MEQFTSEDKFEIAGRGTAYAVRLPETMDNEKIGERYIGKQVMIDGKVFTVKGVEAWAIPTLRAGAPISFLVE